MVAALLKMFIKLSAYNDIVSSKDYFIIGIKVLTWIKNRFHYPRSVTFIASFWIDWKLRVILIDIP